MGGVIGAGLVVLAAFLIIRQESAPKWPLPAAPDAND